jgi:predicted dehydrogenase
MAFPHDYHRAVMADFVAAIREGREPRVTGEEALKVHRLIDALIETGRTGAPVRWRGMTRPLRFAAIGLDHRHIYHHVGELIAAGASARATARDQRPARARRLPRALSRPGSRPARRLFDDPSIDIIVCAAIPRDRPPSPSARCAPART